MYQHLWADGSCSFENEEEKEKNILCFFSFSLFPLLSLASRSISHSDSSVRFSPVRFICNFTAYKW
jgi:hypothetical protein